MEKTINHVFRNRVEKYRNRTAVEKKLNGEWQTASWKEYYRNSRAAGLGLCALGLKKGDRVCILSENRLEWLYSDMGTLGAGAVVVPIYTTLTSEEIAYIIGNSESRFIFVENDVQLNKVLEAVDSCPTLEKIILFEEKYMIKDISLLISFKELLDTGKNLHEEDKTLFGKISDLVEPDDLATIVYTSGTTGVPKGAMISHKNIMAVVEALDKVKPPYAYDTDHTVPFLPLSHVFERVAGHFYGIYVGITASYAENIDSLLVDFYEKKPTVILAVPRVCEKVYQKIISQVQEQSKLKQKVFYWGQKIGARISELKEARKPIPVFLNFKYKIAYKIIFQKLMEKLGGRVRWMTASGAPTAREIIQFFNAAGIMVIQGYGMTECTAPATMQNISHYKIGSAGEAIPCNDLKISDEGEILIKGDNVIKGYWKMEQETKESFTEDGYIMSGDIGFLDENGFLFITDRKKDLIITSGGKNVAPQKIENLFKSDPLFSQFIVIGEKKKYLSALCNINLEQAERIAKEKNIPYGNPAELLKNDKFLMVVQKHVDQKNSKLARFETIKKYRIIEHDFSQDTGELTPSLKVKRKVVREKYRELIDSMYEKEASDLLAAESD